MQIITRTMMIGITMATGMFTLKDAGTSFDPITSSVPIRKHTKATVFCKHFIELDKFKPEQLID